MPKIDLTHREMELLLAVVRDAKDNCLRQLMHVPAPEVSLAAGDLTAMHEKLQKVQSES